MKKSTPFRSRSWPIIRRRGAAVKAAGNNPDKRQKSGPQSASFRKGKARAEVANLAVNSAFWAMQKNFHFRKNILLKMLQFLQKYLCFI
jgi:hypothetical protein